MIPVDFDTIAVEELPQARRIARWMKAHHPTSSILDIGCGPGLYVEEMRKLGLCAFGVDSDERLVESIYLWRVDITKEPTATFDVALSLEVGEHIPEDQATHYIGFIAATGAHALYFSAAAEWQTGPGHINLKPKSYWSGLLNRVGFILDIRATDEFLMFMEGEPMRMGWLMNNGMVFHRG
jgi:SAM-dependent methyltransferase